MVESSTLETPPAPASVPALAHPRGFHFPPLNWLLALGRNMFGMDYRSLALLRVGLAFSLLWVAYSNAWEARAFYTDEGVLPRTALLNSGYPAGFSLFFANGSMAFAATLFTFQFLLAFMMLVGYRTRLATVGSFIFLLSMQNRQPVLLYGADISLRVGLFWAMFLPLARRYSLDSLTGRTVAAPSSGRTPARTYLGIPCIAFFAQLAMIYIGGALLKTGNTWQVEHSAVAYALALDCYSRPFGHWLGQFDGLTHFLTIVTLNLEFYGPFLFILPFISKWSRTLAILLFAGLQISFGLCMTMGVFGTVMISLTLPFLPAFFWDRFAEPFARGLAARSGTSRWRHTWLGAAWLAWLDRERARNSVRSSFAGSPAVRYGRAAFILARDGALLWLLGCVILLNWGITRANSNQIPAPVARLSDRTINFLGTIGLDQRWDMFAPDPQTTDGWFVVTGTLLNGDTVDLLSGATPASFERPPSVSGSYQSQIWMSYLISYWNDGSSNPAYFVRYLRAQWNDAHSGDERLRSIDIDEMEDFVLPGPTKGAPQRRHIYDETF